MATMFIQYNHMEGSLKNIIFKLQRFMTIGRDKLVSYYRQ